MINTIAKLLLKSTGLFTAFVLANNKLNLKSICETLEKFEVGSPNTFAAQLAFMFLCIFIIYVGYYIFSDIAKTLGEGVAQLTKNYKDNKNSNKENKTLNELTEVLNRISYKLDRDNSRNYPPNTIDDSNRRINEGIRPPTM